MIATSDKWREAQLTPIVPESFVEITYSITEPGLQETAVASTSSAASFSDYETIVDMTYREPPVYAMLERNLWLLDGSRDLLSETDDTRFASYMICDRDGVFATPPVITITLPAVHEQAIPGITIRWSTAFNEYARKFSVWVYRGSTRINAGDFIGTSNETECMISLAEYDKIQIQITEWSLPYRRARVENVFLGATHRYTKDHLLNYTHTQSADLLTAELPKNSIAFSLNNADGLWNPDNPSGYIRYLLEQQEVKARYGFRLDGVIEWIDAGTFWISEWDTPSNGLEARFTARDLLVFMGDTYTGPMKGTLHSIASAAFEQSNLPTLADGGVRYAVSDTLKEYDVDFSESSSEYTCAEIAQLCANAACCVMYQDRNGVMRIEEIRENSTGYAIRKMVSYAHPEFTMTKPLKSVTVNSGLGTAQHSEHGEIQKVENPLISDETRASHVAEWVREMLGNRKIISGEYRADPSLDVLDKIAVESKYGTNNAIYVTEIEYTYTGAFRGKYTGRSTDFDVEVWHSGELISGEV